MIREVTYNPVFDAQLHFRLIMDSLARPGKINKLDGIDIHPPTGINNASAFIAMALLNQDVSFFLSNQDLQISDYITINTASKTTTPDKADFMFINGATSERILESAQIGTLLYPETGAFVIIDVDEVSNTYIQKAKKLVLSGPGNEAEKEIYINNITDGILVTLSNLNSEFPLGVEVFITDRSGSIIGIPRSNKISYS